MAATKLVDTVTVVGYSDHMNSRDVHATFDSSKLQTVYLVGGERLSNVRITALRTSEEGFTSLLATRLDASNEPTNVVINYDNVLYVWEQRT